MLSAEDHLVNVHEVLDLRLDPRLFTHLAAGCRPCSLAGLDMPSGQAPSPLQRALGALDEQHLVAAKDGCAGSTAGPARLQAIGLRILGHACKG